MDIRTFERIFRKDPECSEYTLVRLSGEYDDGGGLISYSGYFPTELKARNILEEIQRLKWVVIKFLEVKSQVVIIDDRNTAIFSDIRNNPYFTCVMMGTGYQYSPIDADTTIAKIVEAAFPILENLSTSTLIEPSTSTLREMSISTLREMSMSTLQERCSVM